MVVTFLSQNAFRGPPLNKVTACSTARCKATQPTSRTLQKRESSRRKAEIAASLVKIGLVLRHRFIFSSTPGSPVGSEAIESIQKTKGTPKLALPGLSELLQARLLKSRTVRMERP